MEQKFTHNSTTADSEPDWGSVDKAALPRAAFADHGEPGKKSTWGFPHHWVQGGGDKDENGLYTSGTMYLHKGGLNAAWSAANGGRTGQEASQEVKDHLQAHRRALGLDQSVDPDLQRAVEKVSAWVAQKDGPGETSRAWSRLVIKAIDNEQRIIEGIATTPAPDRMDDIVESEGMQFSLPFPFLYQHNSKQPIGEVTWAKVTKEGIPVKIKVADLRFPTYIDEAWALIKAKLVRGLSVGFRALEWSRIEATGGFRYIKSELLELSAVTIPANVEATITAIKAYDRGPGAFAREAPPAVRLNRKPLIPGAAGSLARLKMKPISEQISAFEARWGAIDARMKEIMNTADEEDRTLDEAETEEYDRLAGDAKAVQDHLVRLREMKVRDIAAATAVPTSPAPAAPGGAVPSRTGIVRVSAPDLPKGTAFVRYAIALMLGRGSRTEALAIAQANKHWKETTPAVELVLKDAVAAGTTTATGWAAELVDYQTMASEFIEFLRPMTIIGKLMGQLRRVPFNIKIQLQDAGASVGWVGQGGQKPVSALNFDTVQFGFAKASGIVVITDELARFSNPSAEALVRRDLAGAIVQFLDQQFVDPTVAVQANVHPASITNGASSQAASGTTADDFRADLQVALAAFEAAEIPVDSLAWIMRPSSATGLMLLRNALGGKEFPDITPVGGTLESYQVVTSNSAASGVVTLCKPSEILLADDDGIMLDASREATITMDDGTSPPSTTQYSMFQNNMIALRVERIINWARRRDAAVYYLTGAAYGPTSP